MASTMLSCSTKSRPKLRRTVRQKENSIEIQRRNLQKIHILGWFSDPPPPKWSNQLKNVRSLFSNSSLLTCWVLRKLIIRSFHNNNFWIFRSPQFPSMELIQPTMYKVLFLQKTNHLTKIHQNRIKSVEHKKQFEVSRFKPLWPDPTHFDILPSSVSPGRACPRSNPRTSELENDTSRQLSSSNAPLMSKNSPRRNCPETSQAPWIRCLTAPSAPHPARNPYWWSFN